MFAAERKPSLGLFWVRLLFLGYLASVLGLTMGVGLVFGNPVLTLAVLVGVGLGLGYPLWPTFRTLVADSSSGEE